MKGAIMFNALLAGAHYLHPDDWIKTRRREHNRLIEHGDPRIWELTR